MPNTFLTNEVVAAAAENGDFFVAGFLRHVHADAALEVSLEGQYGSAEDVFPVGRYLEGGLFLLLEVVNVCLDLLDALDERGDVLIIQMASLKD